MTMSLVTPSFISTLFLWQTHALRLNTMNEQAKKLQTEMFLGEHKFEKITVFKLRGSLRCKSADFIKIFV